ncbi:MAG: amino acid ABC transporter permease [Chloroflexi bacterium]|nr:amino acid ABC transporter permease [Chloroflexota bacterium]MCY4247589.1 amino acid ABC transporter permease [Chloroflexota bacterium]
MADHNVDASKTIIHYADAPTLPPPRSEAGISGWLRQNLFGSPIDIAVSALSALLVLALAVGFFDWAVRSGNWFAIINNQRLLMMESFESAFEWRLAVVVLLSAFLTGISLAAWARAAARALTMLTLAVIVVMALLPPLINAGVDQPSSYFAAGNVDVIDRASALTPQRDLAFIAAAGETVSVSLALDEVADIETLRGLAGFSDRATNALANAANNRVEQQHTTGETFDRMLSGELTEALEERARLSIRTFRRTNDMLASTREFVESTGARLADSDATIAETRWWLDRLKAAARAADPRQTAILDAVAPLEDGIKNFSMSEALPAQLHEALADLTAATLASDQLDDLGDLLIVQLSEDLIGQPDQSNADEELINPSAREAAFLRDMFVRLLTPQSVLDIYQPGQAPMQVAIRDARSLEALADGLLSDAGDRVTLTIPRDGWYIFSKNAAAGHTGSAILAVSGIYPIIERTLSATESRFVRVNDDSLVIREARPQIDGGNIPFAVLIDNQFRGLRDLSTYLIHFIPPFFMQLEALLLPFFITVVWGFVFGRGMAHMLGGQSVFNAPDNRLVVVAWVFSPLLVLIAYFVVVDGGSLSGIPRVALQLAAAFGAVELARRIEAWLCRSNAGEEAEGSLNRLLLYGWVAFPFVMYVMASGVGGLSGAALASGLAGLLWLLAMLCVGMLYRGAFGYALLAGGFFLPLLAGHIINIGWAGWVTEPISALALWLALAAVGILAGLRGESMRGRLSLSVKRFGYLLGSLTFVFIFVDINLLAGDDMAGLLAGAAFALWLGWMFFSGVLQWNSTRIIIGLLLLTFLWLQAWTSLDRASSALFIVWMAAGALAFKRGESEQGALGSRKGPAGALMSRLGSAPARSLAVTGGMWLAALLFLPSLISGLAAQGILQTSASDLLPISDKRLWGGLMLTMQLTILGVGASFPIGLALALGRRSSLPVVKTACILYIEAVRGVPLITVLFMATLLVPLIDPTLATIEGAVRAWVGITMFSAAYLAENVRGGLQSIGRGQTEAAQAIGLSTWQTTLHILLPQALRAVIPALVGQFISLFKDTSLVYIVGLAEILGIAQRVVAQPEYLQRRQETFLYVAIVFFVFSYIMSYISRKVEATGSGAVRAERL